ncbi:ABC transporter ATP-binding protein [Anoxybacillus ayderensis]|uniref:ABC transporter ATP-binding protein n=1 Tax=Anoxybacillus TaxID=150247 RepID=UPI000386BA20|nr:ABC transporter ATP-binding protein [Anoxybacillus ayderensis]KHF29153.1 High-affinity branched-chain amino acid transport ATP-binding protein LivF [Anoxybacillus sp. BCO1]NNU97256.1 ABC transporter ATP-binding protein [Anoxybacillus sp. EFIL]EPZ39395.1 putative branched-chain amino acid ABC transporter ATP-binding protein [Anoxybacillus ayderensis]MBA2878246.1 branched-chain amino acid transport system ATP-binding protein [Anoxybacillus ayderensis]MED0688255.1 ABC transporter ATP-binding p
MSLLRLERVHTFYGGVHALKGIDLEVCEGEIVTLIGSNGAGKSTTLKTISGQVKAKSGSIVYEGKNMTNTPPHVTALAGIAHVPEGRRIFPRLTVKENLEMGAFSVNDKKEIAERMERVFHYFPRLKERLQQKGGTMSGGEQQMLAIGRALMMKPKLLMLDEPSMGLAPIIVEQIFHIIRELNDEGMTILLVEQNAFQALQIAHRGYVIQTGEITMSGTGKELLGNEQVREAYLG